MILADKGDRLANFIVDTIAILGIALLLYNIAYLIWPEMIADNDWAPDILFYSSFFCYYFFFELFSQKTPGKMLTKTMVVDRHGNKPTAFKLIIRTLMRLFPLDSFTFLFGTGLHDTIGKTKLVKVGQEKSS